jgi:hypothetical protein
MKPILQGHVDVKNGCDFLATWYELVTDYSELKLTYPSDKLIALAGITSRLHVSSGYFYFNGLWNNPGEPSFILSQLLWHTVEPDKHASNFRPEHQSPSFSWASTMCKIDYPITFHNRIFNEPCTIISGDTDRTETEKENYFKFLYRYAFKLFRDDGNEGGDPWKRDIEFRAKLISLHGYGGGYPNSFIVLQGPLKEVMVQAGNIRKEGLV